MNRALSKNQFEITWRIDHWHVEEEWAFQPTYGGTGVGTGYYVARPSTAAVLI